MKKLILLKLIIVSALCMSIQASAQPGQSVDATIDFSIAPVTTCEGSVGPCLPVSEYRIYIDDNLLATSSETAIQVPFNMIVGQEYCFEATAFNGLESARSAPGCYTPTPATPDAPVIISLPIRFG